MKVTALALDPIEKKPLARYKLGSMILSVGGLGCTMRCPWCQNHTIAQPEDPALVPVREMSIDELVEKARALVDEGNIGLAYTYNEPLVHWREVVECARAIHEAELDNVLVTNGLIAADKLEQLLPHIDAYNIDLKGFDQSVYDITGGKLETVKNTIERANENAHVEVTTLAHSRCQRRHGEARRGGDMAGEREPGHTPAPHALLSPVSLCRPPRNAPGDTPRGPGGHQQTPQRRAPGNVKARWAASTRRAMPIAEARKREATCRTVERADLTASCVAFDWQQAPAGGKRGRDCGPFGFMLAEG